MNDKNARNAADDTCDMHGPIELDEVIEAERKAIYNRRKAWFTDGDTLGDEDCFFGVGLSGGGIRSASFCLGALQALDAFGLIKRTDYLSTVSGGGYIGTGMVASMTRHAEEQPREADGKPEYFFPYSAKKDKKTELRQVVKDNEAISHLRDHSKFLIPHGISDVILSLAVIARGLAVNLFLILVLIVPLAAITIAANPTEVHLDRSVFVDILAWYCSRQVTDFPEFLQTFALSKMLGLLLFAYLIGWGVWRSCLERDKIQRSGLDALPKRGTLAAQTLAMLLAAAFAFELQGPILHYLLDKLQQSEAANITLPSLYAVLVALVGATATIRSTLVGVIQKALLSPGIGAVIKVVASRLLLVLSGLIVPFLIYSAYLGLCLWGIVARPIVNFSPFLADFVFWLSGTLAALGFNLTYIMPQMSHSALDANFVSKLCVLYVLAIALLVLILRHIRVLAFTKDGHAVVRLFLRRLGRLGRREIVAFVAFVFFLAFVVIAAVATRHQFAAGYDARPSVGSMSELIVLWNYVLASLVVILAAFLFSPNANSLHGLYRDRLSVAFRLGATRDADTKPMLLTALTEYAPYLLVNATLNARVAEGKQKSEDNVSVSVGSTCNVAAFRQDSKCDKKPTEQSETEEEEVSHTKASPDPVKRGRNAEFFHFSRDYIGSDSTRYTCTGCMEAIDSNLSLAAATAISGAAFTSNMGRANINALSLTFALLNVRLGYWLSNPKYCRRKINDLPTNLPWHDFFRAYLIAEAFGLLRTDSSKIYVTDGGHVDNLGLYQLLRRRCRVILIIDAEADPAMYFGALVDVQRFARIDLGFRINLDFTGMQAAAAKRREVNAGNTAKGTQVAETDPVHADHFAIGEIDYGDGKEKGVLVYVKALVTGDEPDYVLDYERRYPSFPHESTGDQFFSEEQMEAYRALGFHAVERMFSTPMRPKGADSKLPEKRTAVTRAFAVREKVRAVKTKLGIRTETLKD